MDRHELVEYVRARKDGVVSTLGPDGAPQAAYLGITATDDGDLVFDTHASARKVANLRRDPRVAIVVGGGDRTTLQCEGIADIPVGAEREACARAYVATFPRFQGSMVDTGIVLVRVRLTWARFGDYRPGSGSSQTVDLGVVVRRIRADEWQAARDFRLDALRDEAAGIAFLETFERASAEPDDLYRDRTARAAEGHDVAQLVAFDGGTWAGSVTVIVQRAGSVDFHGRTIEHTRAVVVGVYVRPEHRGDGLIDRLLDAAGQWASGRGFDTLTLGVHQDNGRAQGAYRRAGFTPSGVEYTGPIGPELEMVRAL
jgi:PPOX class probable F420-dependent enzyme